MIKKNIVSIIVPNYNYAQYLTARIESILNQSYQDFELILLDDCSTDNSRKILETYRENPHVSHIVFNENNSGSPFQQWLKGINLAQGKYIWIAEADDLATPQFLQTAVDLLEANPSAAIAFTGSLIIDENNEFIPTVDYDQWTKKHIKCPQKYAIFNGREYAARNLYWKNYIYNASGTVFKRDSFFHLTNDNWINMRCCGDWLFWTMIAVQGDVIEIYEKNNRFRRHTTSAVATSVLNGTNFEESIIVMHKIEQILPELGTYRRLVNRGNCYKRIRRQKYLSRERRKELLNLMKSLFGNMKLAFIIARLNQKFALIVRRLYFNKKDRCTPR